MKLMSLARGSGTRSLQQPPITWLLLLASDVLPNPGFGWQPICPRCHWLVLQSVAALQCDEWDSWLHCKCELLSLPAYRRLAATPANGTAVFVRCPPSMTTSFRPRTVNGQRHSDGHVHHARGIIAPIPNLVGGSYHRVSGGYPTHALDIKKGPTLWYSNCCSVKNKFLTYKPRLRLSLLICPFLVRNLASPRHSGQ